MLQLSCEWGHKKLVAIVTVFGQSPGFLGQKAALAGIPPTALAGLNMLISQRNNHFQPMGQLCSNLTTCSIYTLVFKFTHS
jgi:hypothetical protein